MSGHEPRSPDPATIRAGHAAALQETVTEIGNLLGLVRAGDVQAEAPRTRVLLHGLVKRLRRDAGWVESDLLHLSRDGRWRASQVADEVLP